MSRRKQQRESANPHEQATLTTNEKILKECYDLYTSQDHGNYNINFKRVALAKRSCCAHPNCVCVFYVCLFSSKEEHSLLIGSIGPFYLINPSLGSWNIAMV